MEDRTDAALIHQARTGDREAFRGLVERHQDRVFGLAVTMLGNRTEAEDVAQEVFLKAYRNLAAFRGDARFGTWLYRVTVNACWDVLRKRRREREGT
ncbi:MAG: sigma-70 family RNA polymerase sigma factor, partial [bacterium]